MTMEQITVFGDIHGNLPALEAVLADMDRRVLGNRYCLGDLVGYGVYPNEVTELICAAGYLTVIGNYDQGVGNSSDDCGCAYTKPEAEALGKRSIAWTNAHTTAENKAFLRRLETQIPLQLGDLRVVLVHGSPRRVNEYLFEDRPERSMERLLDMIEADVLVCGHTHIPYHRVLPSGRHIVNAGSVGKPKDGDPRACYVVLSADGDDFDVDFHRVEYDVEQIAQAIEASDMPSEYAQMLRDGKG
jgi:putative phosphoesterase